MPRADEMERSIRCNAYQRRPALTKIHASPNPLLPSDDEPLFAVDDLHNHGDAHFIPVEGWPERRTADGVDHA